MTQDIGDDIALCCIPRELPTGCRISSRQRGVLQSTELKGIGDLKNSLTLHMEMQNLDFVLMGLVLF